MTDFFALLDEPRRPWVEDDPLQQTFLRLSTECHPDRFHEAGAEERSRADARCQELNAACQTLREPQRRLLHLIQLETGRAPREVQEIPHDTTDLFMEVGGLCRQIDAFLVEKAGAASPMLKVQWFERGQEWSDKLQALQSKLTERQESLFGGLRAMNTAWEKAPPPGDPARLRALPLERLEQVYRLVSYFSRWQAQLRERSFQLVV